jgi:hypothetical protein
VATLVELAPFLNWRVGIRADDFRGLTLAEAIVRIDKLALGYVEGSDAQWVSPEIRKNLDYNLAPEELAAVQKRLRAFKVQMCAYRVANLPTDEASRRKVFEFAKALGAQTVVCPADAKSLPALDALANEFGVSVALESGSAAELQGRSNRIGLLADTREAVAGAKDRLMIVSLSEGAGAKDLLRGLYAQGVKPLFFTLHTTRPFDETAGFSHAVDDFEDAVLPVLGEYMIARSKTLTIRGASELSDEVKGKIDAALPRTAPAVPRKPRRLLVMDEHMGHAPIPHANYALERMGRLTGAWETVLSNDLDNLKYGKIRQFDAIMLNSSESDISADPAVREGLLRFVREGGGLGGIHAAAWSAAFWPEFMEMTGASQGMHRVQSATVKIDDPLSPLTKAFAGQPFTYSDEYYRMPDTGPQGTYYSREKLHVLLSVDLAKTPDFYSGRTPFVRRDNDYAVSWIKGYGKGRVFYDCMGHTPEMFMNPEMNQFLLAAVQFLLGDLPADTTPSAFMDVKGETK